MVWVAICLGPDYLKMAGPSHSNLFVVETQETQNHPTALLWGSHLLGFPQRRVRVASVLLSAGGAVRWVPASAGCYDPIMGTGTRQRSS